MPVSQRSQHHLCGSSLPEQSGQCVQEALLCNFPEGLLVNLSAGFLLVGNRQQVSSCQRGDLCAFAHHREEAGFWYAVIVETRAIVAPQVRVELLKLEEASFRKRRVSAGVMKTHQCAGGAHGRMVECTRGQARSFAAFAVPPLERTPGLQRCNSEQWTSSHAASRRQNPRALYGQLTAPSDCL